MKIYKKHKHTVITIAFMAVGCAITLLIAVQTSTEKLFVYWVGLIGTLIWLIFGLPMMITWTIATDNEAVYAMYTLFGKVLRIRKKIPYKEIRSFTISDVGWFFVEPFDKKKFKDIIIIQPNIQNYMELIRHILSKIDPSTVDPRVNMLLAGKFKEAGVSTFWKDVFK